MKKQKKQEKKMDIYYEECKKIDDAEWNERMEIAESRFKLVHRFQSPPKPKRNLAMRIS